MYGQHHSHDWEQGLESLIEQGVRAAVVVVVVVVVVQLEWDPKVTWVMMG